MVDRLRAAREEIEVYHRQRIERAERLATLGEVAASLAHEIKNPLAGIAGAVAVIAEDLPATDPRKEIMDEILSQTRRLNKTVQDLLTFARPATPTLGACDLHRVIDRVLLLLAEDPAAKQVRVVRSYSPGLPRVEADDKQLGQVFLNLLLNSAQAMHGSGQITIEAENIVISNTESLPLQPGNYVKISVIDQGPGIPRENLAKIIDPYFTTKENGRGLGLSVVYSIVRNHGGHLAVHSQVNGTCRVIPGPGL